MPVFYRGPHVRITDKVVEVPRWCTQQLVISDLSDVHVVELDSAAQGARLLGASVLASVVVTVPVTGQSSGAVAAMIGMVSIACAGVCFRTRRSVGYQILAEYHGRRVTLLDTADRRELDRVARALRRALEFNEDMV